MPSSLLFAANNEGKIYTLATSSTVWREFPYPGPEFKKLSAVPHFLWALGGDHQIYVCVHGLDVPIRVREESYENERWIPIEGFSTRLLPTDRYHFSSEDGSVDRSIDKIRLPSMAWQWEGEWKLELTLDGQPLDHDGWTYAVDFPAQYSPRKQWSSYVRRRLWVRSRRYSAMNSWCAIAPLHKDATSEPFIDISIGGQGLVGAEPGSMLVWAVTSHNRVMFRSGVSTKSPEGAKWIHVTTPPSCEVFQLNVGSSGLVWATLLDGGALVRVGITRDNFSGNSWVEIRSPAKGIRLVHISVGNCGVWAISQDKQVWFRKGIKGESAGASEEAATGCGWVEMVGRMAMISVSANDQVWGIGASDRIIYFRIGVTTCDLTGKRWKALHAPMFVSRSSSNASLSREKLNQSLNSLSNRPHSIAETTSVITNWEDQSHSAPSAPTSLPVGDLAGKHFETQLKNPKAWSPVRSVGSVVGTEAHPESDQSIWQADSASYSSFFFQDDEELCWAECEAAFTWVEAGACIVDVVQLPNWFSETSSFQQTDFDKPWRLKILSDLKERLPSEDTFKTYEKCPDTTSWVHTGEARVNLTTNGDFLDCIIQLEWMLSSGTVSVLNPDGATTMHQFSVIEVTCIQNCSEPGNPRLIIHTPRISPKFIKFQFFNDTTLEEWQSHLTAACGQVRNISGPADPNSLWAVSKLGDVFATDIKELSESQRVNEDEYVFEVDLGAKEDAIMYSLEAGLHPGTQVEIYGCVLDNSDQFTINFDCQTTYKPKHKTFLELKNISFHFNVRFSEECVVRNCMLEGKWGEEEREGEMPFQKGQEFHLKFTIREADFIVDINDKTFCTYKHRLPPYFVHSLGIHGQVQPFKLKIKSPSPLVSPLDFYWRQMCGHLKKVESCKGGVTWAISYDLTAWVYTRGWGGGFYSSIDSQNVHPMTDTRDYKVYENQRWNPLTGYTSAGLPTDRHMWSDITGRHKRTRDQVRLISMHWQWVSDWLVDFNVPGGVDKDGWQYAVDFPATYHPNKQFTDLVRRRRWYRRCAIGTTGPWQELGNTKLLDLTLEVVNDDTGVVAVWALATSGQAMMRFGVTKENLTGSMWEHVSSPQPLSSISCSPFKQVWATGKNGCAYWRVGITEEKLDGVSWAVVDPPSNKQLKQISCNDAGVWAIDIQGRLYMRKDVSSVFPEGTQWIWVPMDPSIIEDSNKKLNDLSCDVIRFKYVSVGKNEVWVTTTSGALLRRHGVHTSNPLGFGWDHAINSNWQYICAKGPA